MSLEISSLRFMHVYSSDPLSHALMCIPMRLPPSFHGYLLGRISFKFNCKKNVNELKIIMIILH